MKLAFVNCRTMPGGVLNVVEDWIQQELKHHGSDTEIQLFTLISDIESLQIPIPGKDGAYYEVKIIETLPKWINQIFLFFSKKKVSILSGIFDYRNLIVFYPLLMKFLSFKVKKRKPDQVFISSFAIAKNITIPKGISTTLYLHSPMQYIWSHYEEYIAKFHGWKKWLFEFITPHLRKWDQKHTQFDKVYSNSYYTQQWALEIYGIKSEVKYPKIKDEFYFGGISQQASEYFVFVGRLVNFVREAKLIVELFNKLKLPLIMIGSGPDELELKALAGDTIIFTGWNPEGMLDIIKNSKGLINLTKESFGIWTVEALLLGVPVLGYAEGATPELVDAESGILVKDKKMETLEQAMQEFIERQWNRKQISENIRKKLGK